MKHFTLSERKMLSEFLSEGLSYREISQIIKKAVSSISAELQRNGGASAYDPYSAQRRAKKKEYQKKRRGKLERSAGLRKYITERLQEDWSPEQIAGVLQKESGGKTVVSHETIYLFIYSPEGKKQKLWKHLRHRKKPERVPWGTRKRRKYKIPNRTPIHDRPRFIDQREDFGHWEGDLIHFSGRSEALAVFVERYSRKTVTMLLEDKKAASMEMALHELMASAGQTAVKSITFDNGSENVCHQKIREEYAETFVTFFCDPYCSWQKGTVENTNKLLRQYLPRDIPNKFLNQDYVDIITEKLNDRPRKCLQYATPSQSFSHCSFYTLNLSFEP